MKSENQTNAGPPHDICERSFLFAARIVTLCRALSHSTPPAEERLLAKQLFRPSTSIGANIEESQASQGSKSDYISKMSIACKEARETRYWLRLLAATNSIPADKLHDITDESNQLIAILTTIVKKCRHSLDK